ncbi:MAG: HAMP domain-containing histidine kinase [Spirochaetales bacterium]|nr:HAMP domain-containing histidine kinase [Spirochaetales bacterium]
MKDTLYTYFAPAERMTREELISLVKSVEENPVIKIIMESIAGYVLILNDKRQIVAFNPRINDELQIPASGSFLGMRPGEVFDCRHSRTEPGGCGTSKACRDCGAVIAMMACLTENTAAEDECRITREKEGHFSAVEFRVRATPLTIKGQRFIVFVLHDISDSKRREVLQEIFIHDIANTATALKTWADILSCEDPVENMKKLVFLTDEITAIIEGQRLLLQAEAGELTTHIESVSITAFFTMLNQIFSANKVTENKKLVILWPGEDAVIKTDLQILKRILINMLTNAFDATDTGGIVTLSYHYDNSSRRIIVHNNAYIPEKSAQHIFERSFSTKKGNGHGLGTYCMKLLGEQYLGGSVTFTTSRREGTYFSIRFP